MTITGKFSKWCIILASLSALLVLGIAGCGKSSPLLGTWTGTLDLGKALAAMPGAPPLPPGAADLKVEISFAEGKGGLTGSGTLQSGGQGGTPISLGNLQTEGKKVSFTVNGMGGGGGSFDGQLNADGTKIDGQWTQGGMKLPLTLTKVADAK